MADGQAKGGLLLRLRDFVHRTHGKPGWADALRGGSEADRQLFEGIVLVGGWYPVGAWNRIVQTYLTRVHGKPEQGMRDLACYVADNDLNSIFKMVLAVGSPEFLLRRTGSLWSRYFDVGKFDPKEVGPRRFKLTLEAPRGEEEAAAEHTCGAGVVGWVSYGLKLTGADARMEQTRCRFHSAPRCEYDVTW